MARSSPDQVSFSSVAGCPAWGGMVCLLRTTECTTPAVGGCWSSALTGAVKSNTPADLVSWCSSASQMAELTTPAMPLSLGPCAELLAPAHPPCRVVQLESSTTPSLLILQICMRRGDGPTSWKTPEEEVGRMGATTWCLVPLFRSLLLLSPTCSGWYLMSWQLGSWTTFSEFLLTLAKFLVP